MLTRQKNIAPICDRLVKLIDGRRGKQKIAEYMRDVGLKSSDYHNLKKSIPAADKFVDILKACEASPVEIFFVLGYDNDFLLNKDTLSQNTYRSVFNQIIEIITSTLANSKQMLNQNYQDFLDDLRKNLEKKNITNEEFKKILGVTEEDFNEFLAGRRFLDMIHFARIARLDIEKGNGSTWTLDDIYQVSEIERTHYNKNTGNANNAQNGDVDRLNHHST